jgi:integrase
LPREAGNDRVFIGSRSGSGLSNNGNMLAGVLARMGYGHVSVHGFRATFKTWASERTNFPNDVAEMALAHAVGDKTEQAYQRGDGLRKRHALAESWGKFCSSPPVAAGKGTVTSLWERARA